MRIIQAEYAQDWLTEAVESSNKQADWRTDPARAGAGCIGDIGTHAFNIATFVTAWFRMNCRLSFRVLFRDVR